MLKFFSTFIDDAIKIDEDLKLYSEKYKLKLGLVDKDIEQLMEEMKLAEQSQG